MFSIRLADLAQQLNAQLHGDGDITIAGLASMGLANGEQIIHVLNLVQSRHKFLRLEIVKII